LKNNYSRIVQQPLGSLVFYQLYNYLPKQREIKSTIITLPVRAKTRQLLKPSIKKDIQETNPKLIAAFNRQLALVS
jgi:hypothetical protein